MVLHTKARCYRLLVRELSLRMPVEDPVKRISKIATKVEITLPTQQRAIKAKVGIPALLRQLDTLVCTLQLQATALTPSAAVTIILCVGLAVLATEFERAYVYH